MAVKQPDRRQCT